MIKNLKYFLKVIKNKKLYKKKLFVFILILIFPLTYFYILGRPRYTSTSYFVVKKSDSNAKSFDISSFIGGSGRGSIEDSRFLIYYLQSIDVYEKVNKEFNLINFSQKNLIDPFAGIRNDSDYTKKYKHFKKQIELKLDEASGVLKLKTYSFSPKLAYNLNKYIINVSEEFVNKTNKDIINNQLEFSKIEGLKAKEKVEESFKRLEQYQKDAKIINIQPEIIANANLISALEMELTKKKIQLATLKRKFIDPKDPEIISLNDEVFELSSQIRKEREATVSSKGKELNKKLSDLSKLKADLDFSNEIYKTTLSSIEKSRIDSLRKKRFITVLSKPIMPEKENLNWRHKGFFTAVSIIFILINIVYFSFYISESHYE